MGLVNQNNGRGVQATGPDFTELEASLPAVIPAAELSRLLGGLYTRKTLQNMRTAGFGPLTYRVGKGRKRFSLRGDVIAWLKGTVRPFDSDAAA